jgi:predicted metal-dependent peptidase
MAMLKSLIPNSGSGNGDGDCEGGSICKSDNLPSDVDHRNDQDIDDQSQKKVVEQLKADGIGKMSEANSIKQQIHTVKYEWDKLFKSIVASVASSIRYGYEYRTFSKPNKRLTDVCCTTDILYPTSYEDNYVVNLVVGIDVSGSMGDSVELMYSMIKSIIDFIPESNLNLTILECDTEVTKRVDNFVINQSLIDVGHGGGTDMDAIIRYTQSNKLPYDAIIIMTDGETSWHDTDDNYLKSKVHVIVDSDYAGEDYKCPYKFHRASFSELKSKK